MRTRSGSLPRNTGTVSGEIASLPITTALSKSPRARYIWAMSSASTAPAQPDRTSTVAQRSQAELVLDDRDHRRQVVVGARRGEHEQLDVVGLHARALERLAVALCARSELSSVCSPVSGSAIQCRVLTWIPSSTSSGRGPATRSICSLVIGSPGR